MSSWVWFVFTETSVGAGKNNEYREPKAYGLWPIRIAVQLPAESAVKGRSAAMTCARVICSRERKLVVNLTGIR